METDSCIREDEKLDELFDGRIRIIQKKAGYRFSLDAILLAHFAARLPAASIIDLGTGSGIVPLILARKEETAKIVGVEVQPGLADMARRTIALNGLADRVSIVQDDMRELTRSYPQSSFDLVVSNPPYYPLDNGRINPDEEKAIARHEIKATVKDIIRVSNYLAASTGSVLIIFPAKRLIDLLTAFMASGLKPRALRRLGVQFEPDPEHLVHVRRQPGFIGEANEAEHGPRYGGVLIESCAKPVALTLKGPYDIGD